MSNKSPLDHAYCSTAAGQDTFSEEYKDAVLVGDKWVKNCSSHFDNIDFEDPRIVGSLVPLGIVCLIGTASFVFGLTLLVLACQRQFWWSMDKIWSPPL